VGSITISALILPTTLTIQTASAQRSGPFVEIDNVSLQRTSGTAVVTAHVKWNAIGVSGDDKMTVGDLRLVAVSDQGHLPFVLDTRTQDIAKDQNRDVTFTIDDARALAAMRASNRIVLTASQHQQISQGPRTDRTYVTVAELQPYGSPQPHIGTKDCSDIPIVPGAMLRYCDLTGAYLDGALVSIHDPNSDEGKRPSLSTRMERADLTGATAVRSDFSGASIAGGRINGIDMTNAKLDNLSLAGTDAVEIHARGATSDKKAQDSGANLFRANLTGADLRDTIFLGVSVARARLDDAKIDGATWQAIGDGATFRDTDFGKADLGQSTIKFADFADSDLKATTLTDLQLEWAWLCRTTLPAGSTLDGSRDCRTPVEPDRKQIANPDQAAPFVTIDHDSLGDAPGARTVKARITWNVEADDPAGYGMTYGDVRLLAVDRTTGVPTVLDTQSYDDLSSPADYSVTIDDVGKLRVMARGNRIVLTATQHPARARGGKTTGRSYVTVDVLQRGPGLGRVGSLDCSRVALTSDINTRALDFCDFSGAMLNTALVGGPFLREVDLTGSTMAYGKLTAVFIDGSRLAGMEATGVSFTNVSAYDAWAPRLNLASGQVVGSPFYARNLDDADFTGTTFSDSPLTAASLQRANFSNAVLIHPDLAYTNLYNARLDDVDASHSYPSLFLANLIRADMTASVWNVDETGENPWVWATLCDTKLPSIDHGISGDRDCRR